MGIRVFTPPAAEKTHPPAVNWIKENPIPAGIIGTGILVAAAASFLAAQASTRESGALDALSQQTSRLEGLQRRNPPATDESLADAEKSLAGYRAALAALATTLAGKEEPLEAVTPEKFQDELRQSANTIAQTAADKKTTLPEPFLLGFEEFQSQLPPADQTPELHREFKVVRRLVESLLAAGVSGIDLLERVPPADAEAAPGSPAPKSAPPTPPGGSDHLPPPPKVSKIRLGFTAKQDSMVGALNLFASDPQFLAIRSLVLENSNPEPPPKQTAGAGAPSPDQAVDPLLPGEGAPGKLDTVLGRELVKAMVDFEIFDFPPPMPAGGKTAPLAPPPD